MSIPAAPRQPTANDLAYLDITSPDSARIIEMGEWLFVADTYRDVWSVTALHAGEEYSLEMPSGCTVSDAMCLIGYCMRAVERSGSDGLEGVLPLTEYAPY